MKFKMIVATAVVLAATMGANANTGVNVLKGSHAPTLQSQALPGVLENGEYQVARSCEGAKACISDCYNGTNKSMTQCREICGWYDCN